MIQDDVPNASATQTGKAAPEPLALRARPRPVTRLSRRMLAFLVGGLAAAVLGATMWSLQAPKRGGMTAPTELYNVDRVAKAPALDQLPADYAGLPAIGAEVPRLGPPLPGDLGPAIVKAQPPAIADDTLLFQAPAAAEQDALQKEAEVAATSSVFFRSGQPRSEVRAAPSASVPESASSLVPLDPLAGGPASMAVPPTDPLAAQNRQDQQDQKAAFQNASTTKTRNAGHLQTPASPYQVMAGTVIAAALVTGIQSDLPGDVIGTVTEPIYDTATGRYLLIPQGARILGKYNSQLSDGQERVQVVWHRVVLPDTSSLTLDNLVGTDPVGYAGLADGVDRHWGRLFAGAALTTLLGVGAELAAPENRNGNRVIIAGRNGVQNSVNQAGQEMTRRNLNIPSTLTVRPGLPVRVIVNRDLVLRPYQPLFYNRRTSQ
jgi:type IV secretion system protein VirB10